jgi:hypothetical protein
MVLYPPIVNLLTKHTYCLVTPNVVFSSIDIYNYSVKENLSAPAHAIKVKEKDQVKQSLYRLGSQGSRRLRVPICQDNRHTKAISCQPYAMAASTTWEKFLVLISATGPNSIVEIVTCYRLDGPGIESQWG